MCIFKEMTRKEDEQRKQEKKGRKKNYFCLSVYNQEDIAVVVLFPDNLRRGDIHTYIHT